MKQFTDRTQKRKRIEVQLDDGPEIKQKQSKIESFSQCGFISQVRTFVDFEPNHLDEFVPIIFFILSGTPRSARFQPHN